MTCFLIYFFYWITRIGGDGGEILGDGGETFGDGTEVYLGGE